MTVRSRHWLSALVVAAGCGTRGVAQVPAELPPPTELPLPVSTVIKPVPVEPTPASPVVTSPAAAPTAPAASNFEQFLATVQAQQLPSAPETGNESLSLPPVAPTAGSIDFVQFLASETQQPRPDGE